MNTRTKGKTGLDEIQYKLYNIFSSSLKFLKFKAFLFLKNKLLVVNICDIAYQNTELDFGINNTNQTILFQKLNKTSDNILIADLALQEKSKYIIYLLCLSMILKVLKREDLILIHWL